MTLICGACGGQKGSRRLNLCTGRGRRASKFDDARTMPRASTSDEPDILWQLPRRDRGSNAHTPDTAARKYRSVLAPAEARASLLLGHVDTAVDD